MRVAQCNSCFASIIWAETAAGKAMPLDALPTSWGTVELYEAQDCREPPLAAVRGRGHGTALRPLYVPHWASCPQADEWRRQA